MRPDLVTQLDTPPRQPRVLLRHTAQEEERRPAAGPVEQLQQQVHVPLNP
ncbi:MAG: hypothetical protein R3C45_17665 [Phycisphaerales bacterium]